MITAVGVYKQHFIKSNQSHLLAKFSPLLHKLPSHIRCRMLSPSLTDDKFDGIVNQLSLPEKVGLLSGAGACRTSGLQRLNIPSLNVTHSKYCLIAVLDSNC
jgi:hypothetical protein